MSDEKETKTTEKQTHTPFICPFCGRPIPFKDMTGFTCCNCGSTKYK